MRVGGLSLPNRRSRCQFRLSLFILGKCPSFERGCVYVGVFESVYEQCLLGNTTPRADERALLFLASHT